jgi:hypothetical protein
MPRKSCSNSRKSQRGEIRKTGYNAKQVVLRQHAEKGLYAKRTDANGNQTLEPVRKQLEENGRKTERQENGLRNGTRI